MARFVLGLLPLVAVLLSSIDSSEPSHESSSRRGGPHEPVPPVMLWAWHGPHDLSFIDPSTTGIAFLAGTVRLEQESVTLRPGAAAIQAPLEVTLLPVVRLEIDPKQRPKLTGRVLDEVTAGILGFVDERFPGVQLDFDARRSEREFYKRLLGALRENLGDRFLSMTALPSWCIGDPWSPAEGAGENAGRTIDETVPMLFRMGVDGDAVRRRLERGGDFAPGCRSAVGLSSDEPVPARFPGRRLYLFSPAPWTSDTVDRLLATATSGDHRAGEAEPAARTGGG